MAFQIHHDSSHKNQTTNKFGFKKENGKILATKNYDSKIAIKRAPLQASNFCSNHNVKEYKKSTFNKVIKWVVFFCWVFKCFFVARNENSNLQRFTR